MIRRPTIVLLLMAAGCGTTWQAIDADGDGFSRQEGDCWDALEGPAGSGLDGSDIHPSATEIFYDGIDQDCDGADDYDQDGDGWVPDGQGGLATLGVPDSGQLPSGDCWDDTTQTPADFEVVPSDLEDASGRLFRLESRELRELVERMLAYEPEERPSPREVALACKQLIPSLPGPWLRDWSEREVHRAVALRLPIHNDPLVGRLLAETSDDELTAVLSSKPTRLMAGLRLGVLAVMALFAVLAWWAVREASEQDESPDATMAQAAPAPPPRSSIAQPTEPTELTEPVATSTSATASVRTVGDARQVFLVRDGRRHSPGLLPVGTYDIEAHFDGGWVLAGHVELSEDATITIDCDSKQTLCRLQ